MGHALCDMRCLPLAALVVVLIGGCALPPQLQQAGDQLVSIWRSFWQAQRQPEPLLSPAQLFQPASSQAYQLTASDQVQIDQWLREQGFNQYGDPADTVYTGGTPLFDEATGQIKNRFQYIVERHPTLLQELGIGEPVENSRVNVSPGNVNN